MKSYLYITKKITKKAPMRKIGEGAKYEDRSYF